MASAQSNRNRLRAAAAGVGLAAVLAFVGLASDNPSAAPAPIAYGPGKQIARLANPEITESSGLAASHATKGVFWTHNDSGDRNRLFAFNMSGEDLGSYQVDGATAIDWEDLASFSIGKSHYLVIGDVGDNHLRRKSYTLYFVIEPAIPAKPAKPPALSVATRVDFTYEDGPHNCESVGVDPLRKEILLVTKMDGPCKAYVLPLPREKAVRGAVARAVGTLAIPKTTAMDVSPDGLRAIVLTYGPAYEYSRAAGEDWKAAFARPPRTIPMPPRAQGESICYGPEGRTLFLTSEKVPTPLLQVSPADERKSGNTDSTD